jgi:hypothetical protein
MSGRQPALAPKLKLPRFAVAPVCSVSFPDFGRREAARDGRFFLYIRYPEGRCGGQRGWLGSGANKQITGPSLRAALPHWSPDGAHIAFTGALPGRRWNIFLVAAAGGPAEQLTDGPLYDLDPTWSPAGATFAFGQTRIEDNVQTVSISVARPGFAPHYAAVRIGGLVLPALVS